MKFSSMNNNIKNLLTIIVIPVVGYILLNLTFIFAFLVHTIFTRLFLMDINNGRSWIPVSRHIIFIIIILIISWMIFKSKIKELYKAIYSVVPTAVILVTVGIFLSNMPIALYTIAGIIYGLIILYLFKKKKPWYYYYSVSWVSLALLVMGILGIDI